MKSQSDSFVIRIWREIERPGWKGWVQHAQTGEATFVQQLGELLDFIERHTGRLVEQARKGLK